jgi:hypothetical protein
LANLHPSRHGFFGGGLLVARAIGEVHKPIAEGQNHRGWRRRVGETRLPGVQKEIERPLFRGGPVMGVRLGARLWRVGFRRWGGQSGGGRVCLGQKFSEHGSQPLGQLKGVRRAAGSCFYVLCMAPRGLSPLKDGPTNRVNGMNASRAFLFGPQARAFRFAGAHAPRLMKESQQIYRLR